MPITSEKPDPTARCEASVGSSGTTDRKVVIAPRIVMCNKPAVVIYRDVKFRFVSAALCQEHANQMVAAEKSK